MSIYSVYTTTNDLKLEDLNYEYQVIAIDASLRHINIVFPPFRNQGLHLMIIRVDNSANTVTLTSSPIDGLMIKGVPNYNFPVGSGATFISLPSGWFSV